MNLISSPGTDPAPRPRLIPVLDLKAGRPVHAIGGNRAHYEPLRSILHPAGADPVELARACRDRLGLRELYVADLDAILGAAPGWTSAGRSPISACTSGSTPAFAIVRMSAR